MAKEIIGVKGYGGKLEGFDAHADLSQSSDHGYLAGQIAFETMAKIMQEYPTDWGTLDPDKLRAVALKVAGPHTAALDFFVIFQLFQVYLALAAQAMTAQVGDVIEAPHGVKVTNWGRRFNVTVKATCEAVLGVTSGDPANSRDVNPEVNKPER